MRLRRITSGRGLRQSFALVAGALVLALVAATQDARVSVASLQSAPSTVFAVIGDYGTDDANEAALQALVAGWSPDFIATLGDNFYYSAVTPGDTGNDFYESVGKYFCPYLKDVAGAGTCPSGASAVNRFFPAMGNHEYLDALPAPDTYTNYFTLPGTGVATSGTSGNERYYDFIEGPVQFFVINANPEEVDGTSSTSVQAQWLQRQLAASTATWKLVLFHQSPYSSDNVHGSTTYMQWPFAQWGADAVLSAHAHDYERLVEDGIPFFVNGLGAAQTYGFGTPIAGSQFQFTGINGAQRVTATDTSLTFELITVDGAVRDTFTLTKGTPPAPTATPTASATPANAVSISFQNGVAPSTSYAGAHETYISQANPTTNYGTVNSCMTDGDDPAGTGQDLACLMRWDTSAIPAGSTVTAASITVYVTNTSVNRYPIYQVLQPWVDTQSTWQVYGTGLPWSGAGALGAADRGAVALGDLDSSISGFRTLALNSAGVAVVQGWVDSPSSNQGVILADTSMTDGVDFLSSDQGTLSQRPMLTIQYLPPGSAPSATPTATAFAPTATPTATRTPTPFPPTSTATATPTATALAPSATPTATRTPTPLPPTSTPTANLATATATSTRTPTPAPPTPTPTRTQTPAQALALHVGDLADGSSRYSRSWAPGVSVLVHNASHAPFAGATVSGSWSGGISGTGSCVSATGGTCKVTYSRISSSIKTVQFTVTSITATGTVYDSTANHDPDTDSNGTTIVLTR